MFDRLVFYLTGAVDQFPEYRVHTLARYDRSVGIASSSLTFTLFFRDKVWHLSYSCTTKSSK